MTQIAWLVSGTCACCMVTPGMTYLRCVETLHINFDFVFHFDLFPTDPRFQPPLYRNYEMLLIM